MPTLSRNRLPKLAVWLLAGLAVFYPLYVWFSNADLTMDKGVWLELFPALGLLAFSTMWLHIVGGAMREKLNKYIDFQQFVAVSSLVVLSSIILHPLILTIGLQVNGGGSVYDYITDGRNYLIWLAVTAWFIFVGYDILKLFKTQAIVARHWQVIKFVATLGFFLTLVHSLGIGGDLQSGSLKMVWWFYGLTAGIATIYSYILKCPSKR